MSTNGSGKRVNNIERVVNNIAYLLPLAKVFDIDNNLIEIITCLKRTAQFR